MSAAGKTCIYCGAKATAWCDFVLGFEDTHGDGLMHSIDQTIERCDAALCDEHGRQVGQIHFSGKWPVGGTETIDHCAGHDGQDEHWGPLLIGQADQIRYRHVCMARGGLRLVVA